MTNQAGTVGAIPLHLPHRAVLPAGNTQSIQREDQISTFSCSIITQEQCETPSCNKVQSYQCLNSLTAALVGFISRILIERAFFQNNSIPAEMLLYLANDLIDTLVPKKNETLNCAKECTLIWKQLWGQPLTAEEQKYQDNPKEIDVLGEIFNGVKYSSMALLGQNLYSSVASAYQQGLWEHVPAIVGYSGALMFGASTISYSVDQVLQFSGLNQEQKAMLTPWLNMIGRLVVGLVPKVHATAEGVHYHYPSVDGSAQTFSNEQTVSLQGDMLTIERDGQLQTPEGVFQGTYVNQFKLRQVYELTEKRIHIQVVNLEGQTVPVEFFKSQGQYGPEIQVRSSDKLLEEHWGQYFRPKWMVTPDSASQDIVCHTGLTLGAIGSLVLQNPFPMVLGGLSCSTPVCALTYSSLDENQEAVCSQQDQTLFKTDWDLLVQEALIGEKEEPDQRREQNIYQYAVKLVFTRGEEIKKTVDDKRLFTPNEETCKAWIPHAESLIRNPQFTKLPLSQQAALWSLVGMCQNTLSDFTNSLSSYQKSLQLLNQVYGSEPHPDVAMSLNDLGDIFGKMGKFEKARSHYLQSLEMMRKIYGLNPHPDIAKSLDSLGIVFHKEGNYVEAKSSIVESLKMMRKIYGLDPHPDVAISLNNLGVVFSQEGKLEEAKNYYLES